MYLSIYSNMIDKSNWKKKCSGCGEIKVLSEFLTDKNGKYRKCLCCSKKIEKKYKQEKIVKEKLTEEKKKERRKIYYINNKQKIDNRCKEYNKKN